MSAWGKTVIGQTLNDNSRTQKLVYKRDYRIVCVRVCVLHFYSLPQWPPFAELLKNAHEDIKNLSTETGSSKLDSWYERAAQTLHGCMVCWKFQRKEAKNKWINKNDKMDTFLYEISCKATRPAHFPSRSISSLWQFAFLQAPCHQYFIWDSHSSRREASA